jgi:hypothetical protein
VHRIAAEAQRDLLKGGPIAVGVGGKSVVDIPCARVSVTNEREARVVIARARELLRQMYLDEQRAARPIIFNWQHP